MSVTGGASTITRGLAPPRLLKLGAYVSGAVFDPKSRILGIALGSGELYLVPTLDGEPRQVKVHKGAILALVPHPGGGFVTGGDDGRLCHVGVEGSVSELAVFKGRWVERVASHASGPIAAAIGKDIQLLRDGTQIALGPHASTVSDLAFSPDGSRISGAYYGGVSVWNLQQPASPPRKLVWKGSHLFVSYAPNGRYLATSMQENALHCWRLADGSDMQMSGYPVKVKSMAWTKDTMYLVSSGAPGFVCWPFAGKGPQGRPPIEFSGRQDEILVSAVASHPKEPLIAAGYADGRIEIGDPERKRILTLPEGLAAPIVALAFAPDGQTLVAGDEGGMAALYDLRLR